MKLCEGGTLLKKWKQGNTLFGKAKSDPIVRGLFLQILSFYSRHCVFTSIPYKYQKFDYVQNELLSKYFQFGSIIALGE